ncbi:hypothetical protein AJ87_28975 [Rhizobium yanglingense]|nr:hypothetical protein AJ87_28975 [Rhizobium yanglingense]
MAAARLVGQILEEQRVHRPLQGDTQMRDLAFGQGEDLYVGIGHAFEQAGNILLVRKPVD